MAYSSNQKRLYSKGPEAFYSSWWEERGLKEWAHPSCFRLAATTESSLPQIQVIFSLASYTYMALYPGFILFIPMPVLAVLS